MQEPKITVGIMDRRTEVTGRLDGTFRVEGFGPVSCGFRAAASSGAVLLFDNAGREITRAREIAMTPVGEARYLLSRVTIGKQFHWERSEDQVFPGELLLLAREDGTLAAINRLPLETYLRSVISSEMSAAAPPEFLKAHAILSRSWLLAALASKSEAHGAVPAGMKRRAAEEEHVRWYDREDHDLFDVCADDHCQRYQGITKITSGEAERAVADTRGMVLACADRICDARYSKCCGGITEEFATAWDDRAVPYLRSVSDAAVTHGPVSTEEDAARWVLSSPEAYCNTQDEGLLATTLPDFDRETRDFFRWTVVYSRQELEGILRDKSGIEFGTLRAIVPLRRGPSGRISRLRVDGSKASVVVGKELEIRRWLSPTHLYSSAFVVTVERDASGNAERVSFHGAGWGHGVGLCQVGAAVMAHQGFVAEDILKHYFTGVTIEKRYE